MELLDHILQLVENHKEKRILQIGAHDDDLTKELAKHFKKVCLYFEFIKIPEYKKDNIEVRKLPSSKLINVFSKFDVLFMENEFHHFPDIYQMKTYSNLLEKQNLIIKEWDTTDQDPYYKCFQDCRLLHEQTKQILQKFEKKGVINVQEVFQEDPYSYESSEEMIEYFKYILPDYWDLGKDDLNELLKKTEFPIRINEGYFLYNVTKKRAV